MKSYDEVIYGRMMEFYKYPQKRPFLILHHFFNPLMILIQPSFSHFIKRAKETFLNTSLIFIYHILEYKSIAPVLLE